MEKNKTVETIITKTMHLSVLEIEDILKEKFSWDGEVEWDDHYSGGVAGCTLKKVEKTVEKC